MKVFLKILAIFGLSILGVVLIWAPAFFVDGDLGSAYGYLVLFSPAVGALVGAWLVSRGSTTRAKVFWVLGALALGFLVWVVMIFILVIVVSAAMSGYCC